MSKNIMTDQSGPALLSDAEFEVINKFLHKIKKQHKIQSLLCFRDSPDSQVAEIDLQKSHNVSLFAQRVEAGRLGILISSGSSFPDSAKDRYVLKQVL